MAKINDIHSIVVPAQSANLTAHTYTELYGSSTGCTAVVNGTTVVMGGSSSINVWVNSISGGIGCYLLGENQNVLQGMTNGYYLGD